MAEIPISTPDAGGAVLTEEKFREPPMFAVYLHNDDYTTMEFVVTILRQVFYKSEAEATRLMLSVHEQGLGRCGVYTREIAETKVMQVRRRAQDAGYPLKCTMEEE